MFPNFDFADVSEVYISGFWGKKGTPRRDLFEEHIQQTVHVDKESEEYKAMDKEFQLKLSKLK